MSNSSNKSSNQKRSKNINLNAMRKVNPLKPIALGAATFMLGACGTDDVASIYIDADDCSSDNPSFSAECQATYEAALQDAQDTGPKYETQADCEYDFGANACQQQNTSQGSFFMPLMAGYMLGNLMSGSRRYTPMYTSNSRNSPLRNRWFTSNGQNVGKYSTSGNQKYRVRQSFFNKRPTTTSALKRGGFGNIARATSSRTAASKGWGG